MKLPQPRGPISDCLFSNLVGQPRALPADFEALIDDNSRMDSPVNDDLQISLFTCYAQHYQGFDEVHVNWEWEPSLIAVRKLLEAQFEFDLRKTCTVPAIADREVPQYLLGLGAPGTGPSLSNYMKRFATVDQFREYLINLSPYHLMEADPQTLAIPRLTGAEKAALIEIQADEYGGASPERMHSRLFALAMTELDLDPTYGAYIDVVTAPWIANLNLISMFGLNRRLRGSLLGNLALFEIGSSIANRRASEGMTRLGLSKNAHWFFDEHVKADAVHEQIAAHDMCGNFVTNNPDEADAVIFGALSTIELLDGVDSLTRGNWEAGKSSLRV